MIGVGIGPTFIRRYDPFGYLAANGFTPAMVADTVRGWYAYADNVLGPELVTNGTFDSDTTGWTAGTGVTLSATGGDLRITRGGSLNQNNHTSFSTNSGSLYTVSWEYKGRSSASTHYTDFRVGTTTGGVDYYRSVDSSASEFSEEVRSGYFVATGTTAYITVLLRDGTSGDWVEVDNISVREVTSYRPQRCDFAELFTFARSSTATYGDATGTLQTAAANEPRHNHHVYEGGQWVNKGLLIESELGTQLLHETGALTTQTETVTAQPYTLHFTGTGTVTLSGASTAGPLVGTGTGEENRVSLTFTPSAGTLTLTVSGTVTNAQLEAGSTPSSYIPNLAASGSVTRAAETQSAASGNWAYDSSAMWGAFDFTETYADEGTAGQVELLDIRADANNRITITLDTDGAETGELTLTMVNGGTSASVAVDALSPGIWQESKFAWRVTDSDIAISLNGASEVSTATAIGIPNLSAAAMQFEGMGTRALITQGAGDVGAAGIEEASA